MTPYKAIWSLYATLKVKADMFYWMATLLEQIKVTSHLQDAESKLTEDHRTELLMRLSLALQYTEGSLS